MLVFVISLMMKSPSGSADSLAEMRVIREEPASQSSDLETLSLPVLALEPAEKPDALEEAPALVVAVMAPTEEMKDVSRTIDFEKRHETMQLLQRDQPPAIRLAAAHEILDAEWGTSLKSRALEILVELEPWSVAGELQSLAASDPGDPQQATLVMAALRSFGKREDVLSGQDLTSLFESGSNEVQLAAATALLSRGDESLSFRMQDQLQVDLKHAEASQRVSALNALGQLQGSSTLVLVTPLLSDPDEQVRLAALRAVGQSEDPAALEHLRILTLDTSEPVKRMATRLLEKGERHLSRKARTDQMKSALRRPLDQQPRGRR
jgi:HEAT repeat protein